MQIGQFPSTEEGGVELSYETRPTPKTVILREYILPGVWVGWSGVRC